MAPAVVQVRLILNAAPSLNSRAMMGWTDGITITRYDTKIPQKCQFNSRITEHLQILLPFIADNNWGHRLVIPRFITHQRL